MLSFDSQILILQSFSISFTQQVIQSNVNVRLLPNAKFVAGGHLTSIKMYGGRTKFFDFPVIPV